MRASRSRFILGSSWVEAAPFRAHVRHAIDVAGVPWPAFAVQSGVSVAAVQSLLFGRAGRPVTRIEPRIATRLLRLTAADLAGLHRGWVVADGTREVLRRLLEGGVDGLRLARFCRLTGTELARLVDGESPSCSRLTECLAVAAERLLSAQTSRLNAA